MKTSRIAISRPDPTELNRQFISAIENAKYDEVVRLLKLGANIKAINQEGDTPLHIAVIESDIDMVALLITNKADVNAAGRKGNKPLHYTQDTEIARKLIEHNANVGVEDEHGYMQLHYAVMEGDAEMMALLITNKADVNAKSKYGSPLHFARIGEISEYLIQSKANVNAQNEDGETPLHNAVKMGRIEVMESLIQHNANVHAKDTHGQSVSDYTMNRAIINKLLELGGDAD